LTVVGILVLAMAALSLWLAIGPWKIATNPQAKPAGALQAPRILAANKSEKNVNEKKAEAHPPVASAPPANLPAPTVEPRPEPTPRPPQEATLQRGLELLEAGKHLEARRVLSAAIFSGTLSDQEAQQARAAATGLAELTLLSPRFFEGDPYTFQYTFTPGQTLNAVERKLKLHVPAQLILNINGIARASDIRAGQTVKMIQGPFHAVVSKGQFTLDLFLQREGTEKVFIKRVKVGLGADSSTPVGAWKVGLGKKMINTTWFPPASSHIHKPLRPGDPEYPLGKAGYWIGLVGTDPNTSSFEGYGLHGTNDPASIGQAVSLGCIRLADEDIELVYSLLYEEWSTVQVVP
jgi:lipoprotein-anchoring transpeptidase ErfK/SrfK